MVSLALAVNLWHCAETDDFCLVHGIVPQLVVSAGSSYVCFDFYMLINSYGHISHLTKLLPGLA